MSETIRAQIVHIFSEIYCSHTQNEEIPALKDDMALRFWLFSPNRV